jgi:uncharacterized protein
MIKDKMDADLKTALLGGDKNLVSTLRNLKSAILYAEVAAGNRETGLDDNAVIAVLSKEAKKRQESADLYQQGGSPERAAAELAEKEIIERYLPAQMTDEELVSIVEAAINETEEPNLQKMGQIIGLVKQKVGNGADGSRIATLVREKLTS